MSTSNGEQSKPVAKDKLSELYQHASREEPPEELDARILSEARRAADPHHRSSPFAGDWKVPASIAAALIIGLTVVFQLEDQGELPVPMTSESPRPEADTTAARREATKQPAKTRFTTPATTVSEDENRGVQSLAPAPSTTESKTRSHATPLEQLEQRPGAVEDVRKAAPTKGVRSGPESAVSESVETGDAARSATAVTSEDGKKRKLEADKWYTRIEQLVANGDYRAARTELAKFQRAYPDYDINKKLLENLDIN